MTCSSTNERVIPGQGVHQRMRVEGQCMVPHLMVPSMPVHTPVFVHHGTNDLLPCCHGKPACVQCMPLPPQLLRLGNGCCPLHLSSSDFQHLCLLLPTSSFPGLLKSCCSRPDPSTLPKPTDLCWDPAAGIPCPLQQVTF